MKQIFSIFWLIVFTQLVVACKSNRTKQDFLDEFRENNYNFKLDRKIKFEGISFAFNSSFDIHYSKDFIIKKSGIVKSFYPLNIYFSVEKFTPNDVSMPFIASEVLRDDLLNSFHDAYVKRRFNSINEASVTIKKALPKRWKLKGVIQTVRGNMSLNSFEYYAVASVEVKDAVFIFQWICRKEIMDYTFDDFERVLKSIQK